MTPTKFYKTKCMQSIILLPKISFVDAHLTVLFNSPNPGNLIAMLSLILTLLTPCICLCLTNKTQNNNITYVFTIHFIKQRKFKVICILSSFFQHGITTYPYSFHKQCLSKQLSTPSISCFSSHILKSTPKTRIYSPRLAKKLLSLMVLSLNFAPHVN